MVDTLILYTITGCPKCQFIKKILKSKQVPFIEVNIMEEPDRSHEVVDLVGEFYAPVLVYGTKVIKCEDVSKVEAII